MQLIATEMHYEAINLTFVLSDVSLTVVKRCKMQKNVSIMYLFCDYTFAYFEKGIAKCFADIPYNHQ